MNTQDLDPERIAAYFRTDEGQQVIAAARGEMSVADVFALSREQTERIRAFLVFWENTTRPAIDCK